MHCIITAITVLAQGPCISLHDVDAADAGSAPRTGASRRAK
jgi:hypothetical protein